VTFCIRETTSTSAVEPNWHSNIEIAFRKEVHTHRKSGSRIHKFLINSQVVLGVGVRKKRLGRCHCRCECLPLPGTLHNGQHDQWKVCNPAPELTECFDFFIDLSWFFEPKQQGSECLCMPLGWGFESVGMPSRGHPNQREDGCRTLFKKCESMAFFWESARIAYPGDLLFPF
jgi:hypothetical protein